MNSQPKPTASMVSEKYQALKSSKVGVSPNSSVIIFCKYKLNWEFESAGLSLEIVSLLI